MMVCIYRVIEKDGRWYIEAHRWLDGGWARGMPSRLSMPNRLLSELGSDKPISSEEALSYLRGVSSWVGRYLHYDNPVAQILPVGDIFKAKEYAK